MKTRSGFFAKLFAATLFFVGMPALSATDLPQGLPAGYKTWVHKEYKCMFTKKDGVLATYVLDLYERDLRQGGQFDGIALHHLDGKSYHVVHFATRLDKNGLPRGEPKFFVRMKDGEEWLRFSAEAETRSSIAAVMGSYLSARGTSVEEIKKCFRARHNENQQ